MEQPAQSSSATPARKRRGNHHLRKTERDHLLPSDIASAPFHVYLRKLRIRANVKQGHLAELVGVTLGGICKLEHPPRKEETTAKRSTILAIAKALNLTQLERDALLYKAGRAPVTNWMLYAMALESSIVEHSTPSDQAHKEAATASAGGEPTPLLP